MGSEIEATSSIDRGKYSLRLTLKGKPKSANELYGSHWRVRSKNAKLWKSLVWAAVQNHKPLKPLHRFEVTLTVYRSRLMDFDGCVSTAKPVIDGLKDLVIEDDGWLNSCGAWQVFQHKCKRGSEAMVVRIIEV